MLKSRQGIHNADSLRNQAMLGGVVNIPWSRGMFLLLHFYSFRRVPTSITATITHPNPEQGMPCLDDIAKHYVNPRTTSISMISNAAGVPVGDPVLSRVFKIPYTESRQ